MAMMKRSRRHCLSAEAQCYYCVVAVSGQHLLQNCLRSRRADVIPRPFVQSAPTRFVGRHTRKLCPSASYIRWILPFDFGGTPHCSRSLEVAASVCATFPASAQRGVAASLCATSPASAQRDSLDSELELVPSELESMEPATPAHKADTASSRAARAFSRLAAASGACRSNLSRPRSVMPKLWFHCCRVLAKSGMKAVPRACTFDSKYRSSVSRSSGS